MGDAGHLACGAAATWTAVPGANENKPANCLSWYDAYALCIWDGGFLPTEAEWEMAAAGGAQERIYPWSPPGDQTFGASYAVFGEGTTAIVGSRSPKGDGAWGNADLAGDVAEWVLDVYGAYAGVPCQDCFSATGLPLRSFRGESFLGNAGVLRGAKRGFQAPDFRADTIGVRCARRP